MAFRLDHAPAHEFIRLLLVGHRIDSSGDNSVSYFMISAIQDYASYIQAKRQR